MVAGANAPEQSPDPLAMDLDDDEDLQESITVAPRSRTNAISTPTKSPAKRTPRAKPIVEIQSPIKHKPPIAYDDDVLLPPLKRRPRTPLRKSSPGSNRGTPTPNAKMASTRKAAVLTPTKVKMVTPIMTPKMTPMPVPKSTTKIPVSSISKPLPAPPRKRPRTSESPIQPMPNFDEAFAEPTPLAISRDTFLANESLKRQREARNFVYKGDVSAPKATRSGRVLAEVRDSTEEVDEYGGEDHDAEEEEVVRGPADVDLDEAARSPSHIAPLPPGARPHIIKILSTLTSQTSSTDPDPFIEEDKNEALQGLLNLLKGTVEWGEGNSALVVGARGAGKTRTVARALSLLPSSSKTSPIVVRLSGHAQINDRLAIREMGRQIAEAEGRNVAGDDENEDEVESEEYAPTTLPSHLLALLTTPSPRAIIIILEEFDLFTEHARQALLYCLLDVVQSVKTGPVESTPRGIAVIGLTSRIDTLLLLEKRVKSRFSHRMFRVVSPLAPDQLGWKKVLLQALIPWKQDELKEGKEGKEGKERKEGKEGKTGKEGKEVGKWKGDWQFAVETLLEHEKIVRNLDRLCGLTTDVRNLYRPFITPLSQILISQLDFLTIPILAQNITNQIEGAGWGLQTNKLIGLSQPCLVVLIISKHLSFAGRDEFNFAQVEEEYLRFARTKLVGSGRVRWPVAILRMAYDQLLRLSILIPTSSSTSVKPRFKQVLCTLAPHEIVGFCKGDGGSGLGPELANWGRMMGGHA